MISLIAAMSKNRVIGRDNSLPWYLPNDLKHFKKLTTDKITVMGRKTFESIGKPLPGRINVVLTKDKNFKADEVIVFDNIKPVLKLGKAIKDEIFIIGGSQIYHEFLPYADFVYLTLIDTYVEGDALFPELNKSHWKVFSYKLYYADELNAYDHIFYKFRRIL